ncbi:hypothetical protein DBR23_28030 [Acidovorax sp. HMWF018]|nr:hypothetical protein DBR23_28030 [Acidovorax sp. HMWF018]
MLMGVQAARGFKMQGLVGMVMMVHVLRVDHHVCQLLRTLGHRKGTGHANGLPQQGNQQEHGPQASGHVARF